ncbi:MAG: oxygen-insensitive NADPH nitroreductase [Enterococcus sp.]
MNKTIQTLLNHTSVRDFTGEPINQSQIELLLTSAQAASSSNAHQAYSIIGVTDAKLKEQLAILAGKQTFINQTSIFFIFCADFSRQELIAKEHDLPVTEALEGMEATVMGVADAALAAQNLTIAAESLDLGVCYIGGLRNEITAVAELLQIPKQVFPVFGLAVGVPQKTNEPKPRLPLEAIYSENGYQTDLAKKRQQIADYDEIMQEYYATRSFNSAQRKWSLDSVKGLIAKPRLHMLQFLNDHGWAKH